MLVANINKKKKKKATKTSEKTRIKLLITPDLALSQQP